MGILLRLSWAIFASLTSAQTTSFPVSARQAPTTRPTYPVPTTATFTGRLPGAAGRAGCRRPLERRGGERHRGEVQSVLLDLRDERVVVAHRGAALVQQAHHVEGRALPDVV